MICVLRHRAYLGLLSVFFVLSVSCVKDEPVQGPRVYLLKPALSDAGEACVVVCGNGPMSKELHERLGPACNGVLFVSDCAFTQGVDTLLVVADYDKVSFEKCEDVAAPKVSITPDAGSGTTPATITPLCLGDRTRYAAVAPWLVPVSGATKATIRVEDGSGFATDAGAILLAPGKPTINVEGCSQGGTCTLTAGVLARSITVYSPVTGADKATLTVSAAGTATTSFELAKRSSSTGPTRGDLFGSDVTPPDVPGGVATLTATVGTLVSSPITVTLSPPEALQIELTRVVPQQTAGPPRIVAGDPDPICRKLDIQIEAPSGLAKGQVSVAASQGTFGAQASETNVQLLPQTQGSSGVAQLTLPPTAASRLLLLSFGQGTSVATSRTLELLPLRPTGATLAAESRTIPVTAAGSAGATIVGVAIRPKNGASFAPNTRLIVVAEATPPTGGEGPACGTPVLKSEVGCDPRDATVSPGGCLLTPQTVDVAPTGEFMIPVSSRVCFLGKVTVDVYGVRSQSSEAPCLADWPETAGPVKLTDGVPFVLDFSLPLSNTPK